MSANWTERLLNALVEEVRGLRPAGFIQALTREVATTRASGGQLPLWHRVVSVLRTEALPCFGNDARVAIAETAFHHAMEIIGREMQDAQAMRRMDVESWMRRLRESGFALHAAGNTEALLPSLIEHLDKMGFKRAYVALHDGPDTSRLLLAYDTSLPCETIDESPRFPTRQLVPDGYLETGDPSAWVVVPLRLGGACFGHVVLDHGVSEGLLWQGVAEQLSVALELCRFGFTKQR